jgi:hypothetical protein
MTRQMEGIYLRKSTLRLRYEVANLVERRCNRQRFLTERPTGNRLVNEPSS